MFSFKQTTKGYPPKWTECSITHHKPKEASLLLFANNFWFAKRTKGREGRGVAGGGWCWDNPIPAVFKWKPLAVSWPRRPSDIENCRWSPAIYRKHNQFLYIYLKKTFSGTDYPADPRTQPSKDEFFLLILVNLEKIGGILIRGKTSMKNCTEKNTCVWDVPFLLSSILLGNFKAFKFGGFLNLYFNLINFFEGLKCNEKYKRKIKVFIEYLIFS